MATNSYKGFTLIELIVIVAIIGILAAIAIPAYQDYTRKSADSACLIEAKGYASNTLVRLNSAQAPDTPSGTGACSSYSGADSSLTVTGSFTATPRAPGTAVVTCNFAAGISCSS